MKQLETTRAWAILWRMKPEPIFDHEVHEFVRRRWSPLAFDESLLGEEAVLSLFEAARWAASRNNGQPWRFVWSQRDGGELHARLCACLRPGNDVWAPKAPLLGLAVARTTMERDGSPNPWALYDLGLAMGNLTTQASSMGLYVHNMGGIFADKARELFALPPDHEPVVMFAVGKLGDPLSLPEKFQARELAERTRKPLPDLFLPVNLPG